MKLREQKRTFAAAAGAAGMDEKTARKYVKAGKLPTQMGKCRHWRTYPDAFGPVWGEEILECSPTMEAKTLFEYLCRTYEGSFQEVQRGGKGAIRSAKLPHDQLVYNEVSMFCEQLPRIGELQDLIPDPDAPGSYFQNFGSALRNSSARRKYNALERELKGLDPNAWAALKTEALPYLTRKDSNGRGWQQLFDILNQARAYTYLTGIGCSNVRFVPRSSSETPDLEGMLNGQRVLCEVKTINPSAEEVRARQSPAARDLKDYLEDGFFRKFQSDINKAKKQMSAYDSINQARWIVYFNLIFDDFFEKCKEEYCQQIADYLSDYPVEGIEVFIHDCAP